MSARPLSLSAVIANVLASPAALARFSAFAALTALTALANLAGCDSGAAAPRWELGLNDLTLLLPLPADPKSPLVLGMSEDATAPLVPRPVFASLVLSAGDIAPKTGPVVFEDFQLVALRFDLCDRAERAPCRDDADAVFRLVLQPLYQGGGEVRAHDVAVHAFYPVPAAEVASAVAELRGLAQLQNAPLDAPLMVSPALSAKSPPPAYRTRLRALLLRYVRAERLFRLTVFGQDANSVAFAWILRGVERKGAAPFEPIAIPQLPPPPGSNSVATQSVRLGGGDTIYLAEPVADAPAGLALALNGPLFAAATEAERRAAVAALVAVQNPTLHDTGNTQCLSCHVATFLTPGRAAAAGVDVATLDERFTSSSNLSVGGIALTDARVLRGLGWAAASPVISQRAANETAQVLAELSRRFPPP